MVRIAVDAMTAEDVNGKKGLEIVVEGALRASRRCSNDIILVGDQKKIVEEVLRQIQSDPSRMIIEEDVHLDRQPESTKYPAKLISLREKPGYKKSSYQRLKERFFPSERGLGRPIFIYNASQVIGMKELPNEAVVSKRESSVVKSAELVRYHIANIFFSPGNTGATYLAATTRLNRLRFLKKPAIATTIPTIKDKCYTILLDSGVNPECDAQDLFWFAFMGSYFYSYRYKKEKPSIGLINMGTEEYKGTRIVREAHELLLKQTDLNYKGFIEGNDIPAGVVDVAVCDGFVGNVLLKGYEGIAKVIRDLLKKELKKGVCRRLLSSGLGLLGAFDVMRKKMNPDSYGGALLLGIKGSAMIGHGSSSPEAIENAICLADSFSHVYREINPRLDQAVREYEHLFPKPPPENTG